jgi:acyl carrier protein
VAASLDEKMAAELGAIFSDIAGLPVGSTKATFVECGFDSLVLMQIGVELGKRYGVSTSLRELIESQNTIARLAAHIVAKASPERLNRFTVAPPTPEMPEPAAVSASHLADLQTFIRLSTEVPGNAVPSDADAYLREKLSSIRDYIEQQLSRIDVPAAESTNDSQPAVPEPVPISAPVIAEPPAKVGKPLIRVKREQPPAPGAFRSSSENGEDAWTVYDNSSQRYTRVRQ